MTDIPDDVMKTASALINVNIFGASVAVAPTAEEIAQAIMAERERCATVAETMGERRFTKDMKEMLRLCAASIRKGTTT